MVGGTSRKPLVGAREGAKVAFYDPHDLAEHITTIPTISATGELLSNFIILPRENMRFLPTCLPVFPRTAIFGNQSGWNTKMIFRKFIENIIERIQKKRETTGYSGKALILCDNHTTRFDTESLEILAAANIMMVTLPPHTTHILQPIDLVLAHSFKSAYRSKIDLVEKCISGDLDLSARERKLQIYLVAILDAMQVSASYTNIIGSWRRSCLWPLDEEALYGSSKLTPESAAPAGEIAIRRVSSARFSITGGILTDEDIRAQVRERDLTRRSPSGQRVAQEGGRGKRKRALYTTTQYPGLKIVGHKQGDSGETTYMIESPSFGRGDSRNVAESELSPTIMRNYKRRVGLL